MQIFALLAFAVLSWVPPETNTDGTPAEIASYNLYYGAASQNYAAYITVEADSTSYVIGGISQENTTYFAATAVSQDGLESAFSNEASLSPSQQVRPLVVVDGGSEAYTLVQTADTLTLVPVGEIRGGVECDSTQYINGKYVIPKEEVDYYGSVRPEVVVAECGIEN